MGRISLIGLMGNGGNMVVARHSRHIKPPPLGGLGWVSLLVGVGTGAIRDGCHYNALRVMALNSSSRFSCVSSSPSRLRVITALPCTDGSA